MRNNHKERGGSGCGLYYKSHLDIIEMTKYNTDNIEAVWAEVKSCSQRLLIGTVYRPPNQESFYTEFQQVLEYIWSSRKNIIITGDFNSGLNEGKVQ